MAFLIRASVVVYTGFEVKEGPREQLWVVHARLKRTLEKGQRVFVRSREQGSVPFGCVVDRVDMGVNPPEPFYFLERW